MDASREPVIAAAADSVTSSAADVLSMDPRRAAALLDALADRGWPAELVERHEGWFLRAADGVTRRANSVLPAGPVGDPDAALDAAESFARAHGIEPCVQVSPASEPDDLASRLDARGYVAEALTMVQVAAVGAVAAALPGGVRGDPALVVTVADAPDDAWLDAWWSVDGRGGSAELAIAIAILERGPALYAAVRDGEGGRVLATARLALVGRWGGLFAVATRPEARRRGLSRAAMGAAVRAGAERGVTDLWLQVLAANDGARALYAGLGFSSASRYEYWAR